MKQFVEHYHMERNHQGLANRLIHPPTEVAYVYVLTVKHGAMDLPESIGEFEPQLLREAAILHETFIASQKKTK